MVVKVQLLHTEVLHQIREIQDQLTELRQLEEQLPQATIEVLVHHITVEQRLQEVLTLHQAERPLLLEALLPILHQAEVLVVAWVAAEAEAAVDLVQEVQEAVEVVDFNLSQSK